MFRVVAQLAGSALEPAVPPGAIVTAQDLTPSRFLAIDWRAGGAVLLSEGVRIETTDLRFGSTAHSLAGHWRPALPAAGVSMEEIERAVVVEALERHGFVQKEAAAWLGISRRKLNYMVQKMGLTHPSWRRNRDDTGDSAA